MLMAVRKEVITAALAVVEAFGLWVLMIVVAGSRGSNSIVLTVMRQHAEDELRGVLKGQLC